MAKVDWNTEEYESGRSFDAIPKGRYLARIDKIERKDTKDKSGYYYEVEQSVEKGDFKGRKLWARLNVSNKSDIAQKIGREQFNALCIAAGFKIGEVKDTDKLLNRKIVALVDIEKDQQGNPRNVVTGFIAMGAADAAAASSNKSERTTAATSSSKPGIEDDDIPF